MVVLLGMAGAGTAWAAEPNGSAARIKQAIANFSTCPKPTWPRESLRLKQTGTVSMAFLIGDDGVVNDKEIRKSKAQFG